MDVADFPEPPSKRRRCSFSAANELPGDGNDNDDRVLLGHDDGVNDDAQPKKRRFFDDDVTVSPRRTTASPATAAMDAKNEAEPEAEQKPSRADDSAPPSSPSPFRRNGNDDNVGSAAAPAFDQDTFEAVVGHKVAPDVLQTIRVHCNDDMARAVNMYFDGTWARAKTPGPPRRNGAVAVRPGTNAASTVGSATRETSTNPKQPCSRAQPQASAKRPPASSPTKPQVIPVPPDLRYIGAFGVEGWAVRSGTNLLKHGDVVRIERQRIELPRIAGTKQQQEQKKASKPAKLGPAIAVRPNSAAAKRVDVIVRFCRADGTEIGRLAKDTANWVSTLLDQRIAFFEGVCVYAPERLRTNDTVFLQLRAFLRGAAFAPASAIRPPSLDNRSTGLFEEKETAEERDLRLRQVALVRLLQEVNLLPTRVNAAAAKRGRQDLLEAAELADKHEREAKAEAKAKAGVGPATPASTASPHTVSSKDAKETKESSPKDGSTADEQPEDGQELEQDQLDALYRKAQSFDFNTPMAEPPDTFALTLRPYQKQALHWMLAKERDEAGSGSGGGGGSGGEDNGDNDGDGGREGGRGGGSVSMHPLWEEYAWPLKDVDDHDLPQIPGQAYFYVNPYSGDLSLEFPVQDQHCLGGILADEMGLGKTIQMLSLVHAHKSPVAAEARTQQQKQLENQQQQEAVDTRMGLSSLRRLRTRLSDIVVPAPCTTLVVAPMSLLAQWQSEAETASVEGSLRSMVYYGNDKAANLQALCAADQAATAPDLVITSYGVVLSEFTQMWSKNGGGGGGGTGGASNGGVGHPGQGLFSLNFFRIILDEAHTIKNRQSKTAKACYALAAEHRWVLTGTPVVNRLEDLFSLIRFLRVAPWNNFSFWRTFITVPFESKDFMRALDVVQTVLEPLVMRRTKDMKTPDGQPLVVLPNKHVEIVDVTLSKAERAIYDHIYLRVKRSFTANMEAGTVMKSYTSIFAQVLRLRQCCCHPVLVRNADVVADELEAGAAADAAAGLADDMDLQALVARFTAATDDAADANAFGAHVLEQIRDEAANECPICAEEPMLQQTVTGCWHSACKACLLQYIAHETDQHRLPRCFHCRAVLNRRELFEVVRHDDEIQADGTPRISLQRVDVDVGGASSAKVERLVAHLRALRRERPTIKSVVFSQFTSFLSLIEPALRRAHMRYLRLDGTMAQKARTAVLEAFRQEDATPTFTVLLISLRAGGVGLNLTAAKRVYMMDPWWSFAVEAQAIDRVHRMGQDEDVKVYRFIVQGSVEEKMLKIQDRKKFIATSLGMMTDEEKKLQRIEDIKELLS
ncbi:DNA excision repair protein [Niveomyces insectorum RCEF 264]|uniref:DNA excision repair protein n=1 Tax=Niveomyces insectorum RCEF 264 TaxID=1081102 RepID=A0A167UUD5_9HYPO|nr:DNA excision repair protein [Niveomyces insectorum RCEF 264]